MACFSGVLSVNSRLLFFSWAVKTLAKKPCLILLIASIIFSRFNLRLSCHEHLHLIDDLRRIFPLLLIVGNDHLPYSDTLRRLLSCLVDDCFRVIYWVAGGLDRLRVSTLVSVPDDEEKNTLGYVGCC